MVKLKKNIIEMIFYKTKKEIQISTIINPDNYYLSIHTGSNYDKEHKDKINLFIKILNEQNIKVQTFPSMSLDRKHDFNICVEKKYEHILDNIHKQIFF